MSTTTRTAVLITLGLRGSRLLAYPVGRQDRSAIDAARRPMP
jgi:hypothetical protein